MGPHAVPRRPTPAVVTIESYRAADRERAEFHNLVVRAYREWDEGPADEPVRYRVAG